MIHDLQEGSLPFIFNAMDKSPFDFYLTGSRKHHPNTVYDHDNIEGVSDYDFWTQDTTEVRKFLQSIGVSIAETKESRYPTINTSGIGYIHQPTKYTHTIPISTLVATSPLHIQLVQEAETKKEAEAAYFTITALRGMRDARPSKALARRMWTEIYATLGMEEVRTPINITPLHPQQTPFGAAAFASWADAPFK